MTRSSRLPQRHILNQRRLVVSSICFLSSAAVAGPSPASSRQKRSLPSPPDLCGAGGKRERPCRCHPAPNQRAFSMFSQVKIGYCGPSPPPVRLALRPSTAALSQRVRSLGDCSDRMALEKSETVETVVEVINPLLTKTTVVRRKVRSEYTARYEEFCKGGDKVKASSSEFWGGLGSLGGKAGAETRQGKKGEASSSVAGSVLRQLNVAAPKDVRAVAGR